jgi:Co/Zn/Cd efflux system component
MSEWLISQIEKINPRKRRLWAVRILIASFFLGHVNVGIFLGGLISHAAMDTVTNYLSWIAVVVTFADIVATTDVRAEQDEE